jgi:hypothetical protein
MSFEKLMLSHDGLARAIAGYCKSLWVGLVVKSEILAGDCRIANFERFV